MSSIVLTTKAKAATDDAGLYYTLAENTQKVHGNYVSEFKAVRLSHDSWRGRTSQ